ncbi:uncharacterized protein Tco025E_05829 [Trypanosoma conorhini]|uniref:Uncharacterized protein n=1 Tax=Trypanosoma conorhini TaxID=83891 RepID=A0A3R7P8J8_9TRYP|nr:uncharacterized protein Tco025E_05829 [Trypanosoma conorhini]RNF14459.1 hypothetical protein Tco025E_05829 [Trypanosoma conorhini]
MFPAAAEASSTSSNCTSAVHSSASAAPAAEPRVSKETTSPKEEQRRRRDCSSKPGGRQRMQIWTDIHRQREKGGRVDPNVEIQILERRCVYCTEAPERTDKERER